MAEPFSCHLEQGLQHLQLAAAWRDIVIRLAGLLRLLAGLLRLLPGLGRLPGISKRIKQLRRYGCTGQTCDATVKQIRTQGQIKSEVNRTWRIRVLGGWLSCGRRWGRSGCSLWIYVVVIGLCFRTLQEGIEQALAAHAAMAMITALLLRRQSHQLLNREQGIATLNQGGKTLLKEHAPLFGQLAIALRNNLRRQMKTGLLHSGQQAFTQHLEVEGEVAIEARCQLLLLLKQQLELALRLFKGLGVGMQGGTPQTTGIRLPAWRQLRRRSPACRPRCLRQG